MAELSILRSLSEIKYRCILRELTFANVLTNDLQAAVTVVMKYYVFDVQYSSELANTCNFLDSSVG